MKALILMIGVIAFSTSLSAQSTQDYPITLSKAIQEGLSSSFKVGIAKNEIDRAKAEQQRGPTQRFPTIDLEIDQSNRLNFDNSPTSFTDGRYTASELKGAVQADWLLYAGNSVKIDKEKLDLIVNQRNGDHRVEMENVVKDIILAYYKVLIEQEKIKVLEETIAFAEAKHDKALLDYKVERISKFDLNNFKNDLISDSISYKEQAKLLTQRKINLARLMGIEKNVNLLLKDTLTNKFKAYSYQELENQMLANNSLLLNTQSASQLRGIEYKRVKATRKPVISLNNKISDEINTSKFGNDDRENGGLFNFNGGIRMSYNIFDGGRYKNDLQSSKIDMLIAEQQTQETEQALKELLMVNLEEYNQLLPVLDMQNHLISNLRENLTIASKRLESGYSIFVEYKNAKIDLARAELDRLQTIYEMKVAEVELIYLIGGLVNNLPQQ